MGGGWGNELMYGIFFKDTWLILVSFLLSSLLSSRLSLLHPISHNSRHLSPQNLFHSRVARECLAARFSPKNKTPKRHLLADRSTVSDLQRCLLGSFGCLPQAGPWGSPQVSLGARGLRPGRLVLQAAPFPCETAGVQNLAFGPPGASCVP